ncbi:MAG: triose-phosphate isomerase [Candidatus Heimdallarchaeota archaeon]|nr:triose-phosphate isomerase [Candidatus Heimdallarchaeota archaeon]
MRSYVFGGNWKMQLPTIKQARERASDMASKMTTVSGVDAFIAPSPNTLYEVGQVIKNSNLALAGQNMHFMNSGAFTGEVSVDGLLEAGCEYVLLGHSERRRIFGEEDSLINKKVLTALDNDLKVVLCIGETAKERADGQMAAVNQEQLSGSLQEVSKTQLTNVIIAYEPVWAIDNKYLNPGIEIKAASIEEANESHTVVREWFEKNYGKNEADKIRIQYGGSMKASNARELLTQKNIDGGLIGGASLKADTFLPILQSV